VFQIISFYEKYIPGVLNIYNLPQLKLFKVAKASYQLVSNEGKGDN